MLSLFFLLSVHAQVSINMDGSNPDPSAMLDVKSTDKGMLLPRMSATARQNINAPAIGLMVYDSTVNAFYYFNGQGWLELLANSTFTRDATAHLVLPDTNVVDIANDDFVFGSLQLDDNGNSDYDRRFFFDKSKGAFRAGRVTDSTWNEAHLGLFSVAFGINNLASGSESTAFGNGNLATGIQSTAFGGNNEAIGIGSTAFGANNKATGIQSTAFGNNNETTGIQSTAFGNSNKASSFASTAFGNSNEATGSTSTAFGNYTRSLSFAEVATGSFNTLYSYTDSLSWNVNDRLFVVGNGTAESNRSDAFSIMKNGNIALNGAVTIDSAFTLPIIDGSDGQVLTTDGSGTVTWANDTENLLADADDDTKIQVEESADEDIIRFDTGGTQRMTLGSTLDISAPTTISAAQRDALTIRTANNASEAGLAFRNAGSSYTWSIFRQPLTGNIGQAHLIFAGGVSQNDPNSLAERLRISNTGNVGIGIATPDEKLHVNGNTKIGGILNINDAFSFPTTDGTNEQVLETNGVGTLSWVDKTTDTDDQTLSLVGTDLTIADGNTVDLSSLNTIQTLLEDADGDTKIQVEESVDEDIIRFDADGNSTLVMESEDTYLRTNFYIDSLGYATSSSRTINYQSQGSSTASSNSSAGWQSFKATTNGKMDFIELRLESNPESNYNITIYEGEGTGGTALANASISNPSGVSWGKAFITSDVFLKKGLTYTVRFDSRKSVAFTTGNLYPNGRASTNANNDFILRVNTFNAVYTLSVIGQKLEVGGTTTLQKTLNVNGSTTLQNALDVSGSTILQSTLGVSGATTLQNTLSVEGAASIEGTINTNSNWISGDGDNEGIKISAEGRIGIGTGASSERLYVNGNNTIGFFVASFENSAYSSASSTVAYRGIEIKAGRNANNNVDSEMIEFIRPDNTVIGKIIQNNAGSVSYQTSSDRRLKSKIQPTHFSIADLMKIEVKDYVYKDEPDAPTTGFIAQQLHEIYPDVVHVGGKDEKTDPWMVEYGKLTPFLVKAIQDQQITIETQQAEIAQLQAQNARIQQLERQMAQLLSQNSTTQESEEE